MDALEPGEPGQFFMLEAPGRVLPRPFSLCLAPDGELGFLVDPIGPGTRAIAGLEVGDGSPSPGRSAGATTSTSSVRSSSAAASGSRRCRTSPSGSARRPRSSASGRHAHAEAAVLVPNATVVIDPTLVTDALPADPGDVLACGPEPMLDALAALVPGAQLAHEAPMACGYGACYGCVVPRDGGYVRLCVEGPVLRAAA